MSFQLNELHNTLLELFPVGLAASLVTDKEGVILSSYIRDDVNGEVKDGLLEGLFSATFSMSVDQINKLTLGETKAIYTFNGSYSLAHINYFPLVLTLVFDSSSERYEQTSQIWNLGLVEKIIDPLKIALEPLRAQVASSDAL